MLTFSTFSFFQNKKHKRRAGLRRAPHDRAEARRLRGQGLHRAGRESRLVVFLSFFFVSLFFERESGKAEVGEEREGKTTLFLSFCFLSFYRAFFTVLPCSQQLLVLRASEEVAAEKKGALGRDGGF